MSCSRHVRSGEFAVGIALFILTILIPPSAVFSQTLRQYKSLDRYRYLPRLPQGSENPPPFPDDPRKVEGDTKILVDELRGLILVDSPDKVVVGRLAERGIHVDSKFGLGILRTPAFYRLAQTYLGGPISIRRLNELVREIILFYRKNDQPVVDVSVPEQDITDGVVQIVVTEARVGDVEVVGTCFFDPCVLARQVSISPGDVIYESLLMEDLRWLYRNPFRKVELELTPGRNRGQTDVVFKVEDKLPWRVYSGYEDTGNRATGLERTFYGINWFNALGRDDQAGYQYTASSDFEQLNAHSAFYSTALLNRDIITVYGSYAQFNANPLALGATVGLFSNSGVAWQVLTRWYREFCPIGCYEHGITAGFDFKNTNTNLEFGGLNVFASDGDIAQFLLGYQGQAEDGWGKWYIGADLYMSPGHLTGRNNNRSFQVIRQFAEANYVYARGFFERRIWLPSCFEFVARFTGQLSEANLLPTEQLGYGGYNSIRGYDQYSVVGDSGYFVNLELRTPKLYPGVAGSDDELQIHGFYDFGDAYNHTTLTGEDPSVDLGGVGMGLRYMMRPNVELRVDYGWQTIPLPLAGQPRERWHVGVVISR